MLMYILSAKLVIDRAQQTASSKSTVKKEKNTKDKTRAAEAAGVDDHNKSSVDAFKNEKTRDTSHTQDVMSSEPASDKSKWCFNKLLGK